MPKIAGGAFLADRAVCATEPHRLDTRARACFYVLAMSSRSRIKVPAKKPRSWAVTLIRNRGYFLGWVDAPSEKAAELLAAKTFTLMEWQRKRLLVRERL